MLDSVLEDLNEAPELSPPPLVTSWAGCPSHVRGIHESFEILSNRREGLQEHRLKPGQLALPLALFHAQRLVRSERTFQEIGAALSQLV